MENVSKLDRLQKQVIYPTVEIYPCYGDGKFPIKVGDGLPPITSTQMKDLLGWESEEEYATRVDRQVGTFDFPYNLLDEDGRKVILHHCRRGSYRKIAASAYERGKAVIDILRGGPEAAPVQDALVISKTGKCLSVPISCIGFVLACQLWHKDECWKKFWPEEPTIKCLVIRGV